ncbi:MAG: prepilin-type N-terminal cleavage/methylation domain-containing protein [Candidatus Eisenbacteria bacterium]|nr:prepilin-type N-terminal cleavage/methylation domain-containing protein [Candidatus Eisenbacteria bacterium]
MLRCDPCSVQSGLGPTPLRAWRKPAGILNREIGVMQMKLSQPIHGRPRNLGFVRGGSDGFSLTELMIVIIILRILADVGVNAVRKMRAHAEVAACIAYQEALQDMLWTRYAATGEFPNTLDAVLADMPPNDSIDPIFVYRGGEDANNGHGNDWDGHDGNNPGNGNEGQDTPGYYLRCDHDHSLVKVQFVDSGSFLPPEAIHLGEEPRGIVHGK